MRFCTTCGRNFDGSVEICPHDHTPLFAMGGSSPEESGSEQEQAEAWRGGEGRGQPDTQVVREAEPEVEAPSVVEELLGEEDSSEGVLREEEAGFGVETDDVNEVSEAEPEDAEALDSQSEGGAASGEEELSPGQIAADIEDILGDLEGEEEGAPVDAALGLSDIDEALEEESVEPTRSVERAAPQKAGGRALPVLALLVVIAAVGGYVVWSSSQEDAAQEPAAVSEPAGPSAGGEEAAPPERPAEEAQEVAPAEEEAAQGAQQEDEPAEEEAAEEEAASAESEEAASEAGVPEPEVKDAEQEKVAQEPSPQKPAPAVVKPVVKRPPAKEKDLQRALEVKREPAAAPALEPEESAGSVAEEKAPQQEEPKSEPVGAEPDSVENPEVELQKELELLRMTN